ncbi:hypothetical protein E5288_WYG004377 [Bos mutus]|uniref:Uncharacterized protein n=1 Tax=Bos mutus TaxID=72004 RepID=A0A6B0RRG1_9CETA|nr:hypothetical protein [Bos mutus]
MRAPPTPHSPNTAARAKSTAVSAPPSGGGGNKSSIPNRVGPGSGSPGARWGAAHGGSPRARESAQARMCCDRPHPGSQIRRRPRFRCPAAPRKTAR